MIPSVVIVGEAPSRESSLPFDGRSGRRLAEAAGLPALHLLPIAFRLTNLLPEWPGRARKGSRFPAERAREAARRWLWSNAEQRVILAGRRVASAFGCADLEYLAWDDRLGRGVAVVPHPSGVNRWWNDAAHVRAAASFLRDAARRSSGCPEDFDLPDWLELLRLRGMIDATDAKLAPLLAHRLDVSRRVQDLKLQNFRPRFDAEREAALLERFQNEDVRAIMAGVLEVARGTTND